jgi:hypothetical protein
MRTTIDLPEPLLKNAKRRASERGVTLSVILEDALRTHLAARPAKRAGSFKLHTVGGGLVRADINLDRTSELIVTDDEASFGRGSK